MTPDAPVVRGHGAEPGRVLPGSRGLQSLLRRGPRHVVQTSFDELAARTGRAYSLVEYRGAPDAERVIVLMGSAVGATTEAVDTLVAAGERVGVATVRLYRPFPVRALVAALPPTCRSIAVLDRTKEPGSVGEPLYLDVRCRARRGDGRRPAAIRGTAPSHRRPLRPVVQGVHAGDGQRRVRRTGRRQTRSDVSPWASTTMSRT